MATQLQSTESLEQLLEELGLGKEASVPQILETALGDQSLWNNPCKGRHFGAIQELCRGDFAVDGELTRKIELALLRSRLREGRLFELRRTALPVPITEHATDIRRELDPIIDRFVELGVPIEQVRQEILTNIRISVKNCRFDFMLALAGAKCFLPNDEERYQALREYLPYAWGRVIDEVGQRRGYLEKFKQFGEVGLWRMGELYVKRDESDEDRNADERFFLKELIKLLSQGEVALVFQLVAQLGNVCRLRTEAATYNLDADDGLPRLALAKEIVEKLAPNAFDMALAEERFGVAAALSQQFDCVDEAGLQVRAEQEIPNDAVLRREAVKEKKEQLLTARREKIALAVMTALARQQPLRLQYAKYFYA